MPGYTDLKTLTKMDGVGVGIYEHEEPIYNLMEQNEEKQIFKINNSVDDLITILNERENILTEQKDEK